jgi:predicted MFS family arabinose efflux permease
MTNEEPQGLRKSLSTTLHHISQETGLTTLYHSPADVKLLCLQRFVRQFAYGQSTLILVSFFNERNVSQARIGLFMTLTLAGDILISFFLTLFADAIGRRAILACGAALMTASGVVFALCGNYWILLAAAVLGVISPRYVLTPLLML